MAKCFLLSTALAVFETSIAKMRVFRVPQFLGAALMLLVRPRSGGGLVILRPGEHVWIDLVVGRDDPWWSDDVSRSSW